MLLIGSYLNFNIWVSIFMSDTHFFFILSNMYVYVFAGGEIEQVGDRICKSDKWISHRGIAIYEPCGILAHVARSAWNRRTSPCDAYDLLVLPVVRQCAYRRKSFRLHHSHLSSMHSAQHASFVPHKDHFGFLNFIFGFLNFI